MNYASELRKDPVSGDWVIISPGRAKRPSQFKNPQKRQKIPKKDCPFENPQASGHGLPALFYPPGDFDSKKWLVQIIENKYPIFKSKKVCSARFKKGPYAVIEGSGYHEVLISRDHDRDFPDMDKAVARLIFKAFKERYRTMAKDKCVSYISIFKNFGARAGASIYHPHCQIIALPVVPPDVNHSLSGSKRYFQKNRKCVHCEMIAWEKRDKKRVIYENKGAIVFAPFVSREPFEVRIFPKAHQPYFEEVSEKDILFIAEALQKALAKIKKKLGDPDYNFFIHTAPVLNKKKHGHYHWHVEILPKFSISAGFELGTGIETTSIDPEKAARLLR